MKHLSYCLLLALLFGIKTQMSAQGFNLSVIDGYGGGNYSAGDTVYVFSRELTDLEYFSHWDLPTSVELEFVTSPREWWFAFVMPAEDLTVGANFSTVPDDFLQLELIETGSLPKPVYYTAQPAALGTVFIFHGTGGSAAGWAIPRKEQQFSLIKTLYASGFNVVITESEESTQGMDLTGDGKIRWQGYPIDLANNPDYRNLKVVIDTLAHRGVLERDQLYAIGMSNGGSFAGTFSVAFNTQASIIYCASSQPFIAETTTAAIQFCLMPNDVIIGQEGNAAALAHSEILSERGVCSEQFMNRAFPLLPPVLKRAGLSLATAEMVLAELAANGTVAESGFLLFDGASLQTMVMENPANWPMLLALSNQELIGVGNLVNLAFGGHEFYANHNMRSIDFLLEQCTPTGTDNHQLAENPELLIYPNPTNGRASIIGWEPPFFYDVFSVGGQHVRSGQSTTASLSLEGIMPGMYFLQLSKGGARERVPIVIH